MNGVHGGLRDLVTDSAAQKCTTASYFNASVAADAAKSTPALARFAYAVMVAMFALMFGVVWLNRDSYAGAGSYLVPGSLVALFGLNLWMLWQVVRPETTAADRVYAINKHLFALLLPPLIVYLSLTSPGARCDAALCWIIGTVFAVPLLLQESVLVFVINFLKDPTSIRKQLRPAHRFTFATAVAVVLTLCITTCSDAEGHRLTASARQNTAKSRGSSVSCTRAIASEEAMCEGLSVPVPARHHLRTRARRGEKFPMPP